MFTIDGKEYSNVLVSAIDRISTIREGSNSGYVLSGQYRRDIQGEYVSYTVTLDQNAQDTAEYDELFETLSAPVESHTVTFPYGQTTYTFVAMIDEVSDSLISMTDDFNGWGGLSFTFTATRPKRVAT